MNEMNLILTLSLVTFGLVSLWMYQTKVEAEKGLMKKETANKNFRQASN
ncbi:MAG: hypothetical protein AB8B97_21075 [Granulosicoccus sp.]